MAKLVPVDFDPFSGATSKGAAGPKLVPVDFDPFAENIPPSMISDPMGTYTPEASALEADPALVEKYKAEMAARAMPQPIPADQLPLAVNLPPLAGTPAPGVPVPTPRPMSFEPTVEAPVQPLDEVVNRQYSEPGGKFLSNIIGSQTGLITPEEGESIKQGKIAQAAQDYERTQKLETNLEAAKQIKDETGRPLIDKLVELMDQRDNAVDIKTQMAAQKEIVKIVQSAPPEFRNLLGGDYEKAIKDTALTQVARRVEEQNKPAPVLNLARASAETAGETLAQQGINTVGAVQRLALSPLGKVGTEAVNKSVSGMQGATENLFKEDQARRDDLSQKLVGGIASTGAFALTGGVLSKGLTLSMPVATAIAGSLPQSEQSWQNAERRAKEDPSLNQNWRKWAAFATGAGIGATEAIPIGRLFERLEKASGGGFTRWAGTVLANSGEEGLQEGIQGLLSNAQAIALLKDPNVTIGKDVADNMLVGALSGGAMAGVVAGGKMSFDNMKSFYKTPEAAPPELRPILFPEVSGAATGQFTEPQTVTATAGPAGPLEIPSVAPTAAGGTKLTPVEFDPFKATAPIVPEQDAAILMGDGYSIDEIKDMSGAERSARIEEAKSSGSKPVALTDQDRQNLTPAQPPSPAASVEAQGPETAPAPEAPSAQAQALVDAGASPLEAIQQTGAEGPVANKPVSEEERLMKEFQDNWQAEQDAQKPTEAPPSIAAPEAITLTKPEDKSPVNTEVAVENPVPPLEEDNIDKLSNAFTSRLQGEGFKNIVDARKLAKETVGSEDQKLIEESIELATVKQARNIVDQGKSPTETYNELVALYNKQPNLSTRTSTSVLQQAYSTPVPLAYVASRLAGIDKNSSVLEPTAGNGALLIEADQSKSYANELNAVRRRNLQKQGFTPTGHDAAMIAQISPNKSAEVIIANPPFGSVKDENGNSKVYDMGFIQQNYKTTEIDHAIALKSLEEMTPDGRAVLIVGSVNPQAPDRSAAYNGKAKREFYKVLYDNYNVVDHFTADGKLYSKQGASWPVDVITIRGKGKSSLPLPAVSPPQILTSWEQIGEKLNNGYGGKVVEPIAEPLGKPTQPDVGTGAGAGEGGRGKDDVGQRPSEREPTTGTDTRIPERGPDEQLPPVQPPVSSKPEEGVKSGKPKRGGELAPADRVKLFENNTIFTTDKIEAARARMKDRFKTQLNAGFDPEMMLDGLIVAGGYIEAGIKKFRDFAKAMIADFGDAIKPYLVSFYESVRNYPGVNKEGMTSQQDVTNQYNELVSGAVEQTVTEEKAPQIIPEPVEQQTKFEKQKPSEREKIQGEEETSGQVSYTPTSVKTIGLGTLVPINMRDSIMAALERVDQKYGSIDSFVADRLGYKVDELETYFSAEQVDAIALAIDNFEKNAGFIIGDQTGIGKGRVVAAVIRYALKQNLTPIFVTEKPNLYADMYRDMEDIGIPKMLGSKPTALRPRIFMTNSNEKVPLNDDGTIFIKTGDSKSHNDLLKKYASKGDIETNDVVFTTYNQMQTVKGKETERQNFLSSIVENAIIILDESHNAGGSGGEDQEGAMNRAAFVRDLVGRAKAAFYSSATYAKRPDVMDLYFKTDMSLAVSSPSELAELFARGGVPLQQINAAMIAEAGQYIRRERSFAGVTYDAPLVEVDRKTYDDFSGSLGEIQDFSKFLADIVKKIDEDVKEGAASVTADGAVGGAGAESSNFTSIMHNLVGQMLLSMKARPAIEAALQALKEGKKPVLTVANTMESFITQQMELEGLKKGDKFDLDMGDMLLRYLNRTREITIKKPFTKGPGEKLYITDEMLGKRGVALFESIRNAIRSRDFSGLSISPLDYMKNQLEANGYTVGEITGRSTTIDYKGQYPVISSRPSSDTSIEGRRKTISDFNSGKTDVILLNQAGATGLSLHASAKFKDKSPRQMILVQPEANIDTHMQMLGRVHRTGQVVLPSYIQLIANIPAEKRPAAVLAKKMASLSANTTASRKGALSAENVLDFMNEYGDDVAQQYLSENPDVAARLDVSPSVKDNDGMMRKMTGRMVLLPLAQQEELYQEIEQNYKDMIEQLEAQGINTLEAKTLDLDAQLVEERTIREGTGTSPFTAAVMVGQYSIKKQGAPIVIRDAIDRLMKDQGSDATISSDDVKALGEISNLFRRGQNEKYSNAVKDFRIYKREIIDNTDEKRAEKEEKRLAAILDAFNVTSEVMIPGQRVRIFSQNGETFVSLILDVKQGKKTKNPLALGDWRVTLAIPAAQPILTIPFSQIQIGGEIGGNRTVINPITYADPAEMTVKIFNDLATSDIREKRIIATGNILSAFNMFDGRGTIINFTTDDGRIKQGIMMPTAVKTLDEAQGSAKKEASTVQDIINAIANSAAKTITSKNQDISIKLEYAYGGYEYVIMAAKSKAVGGKYYLDKKLIDVLGDFTSKKSSMRATVRERSDRVEVAFQRILDLGAKFDAPNFIMEKKPSMGLPTRTVEAGQRKFDDMGKAVAEIIERVTGKKTRVETPQNIEAGVITLQEARSSGYTGSIENLKPKGYQVIDPDGVARVVVALAHSPLEITSTAYHEADHVLETGNFYTDQERKARDIAMPRLRNFLIANGYKPESVNTMDRAEVLAYSAGLYGAYSDNGFNQNKLKIPGAIRTIFDKLYAILEGVRNWMAGNGYRNIESLMKNQYLGNIAKRAEGQISMWNKDQTALLSSQRMFSFDESIIKKIEAMNAANGMTTTAATFQQPTFREPDFGKIAKFTTDFADEFDQLRQIQMEIEDMRGAPLPEGLNAYLAQTLMASRTSERLGKFRKNKLDPMFKLMKDLKVSKDDIGLYLVAKHAVERNAEMAKKDPKKFGTDGGSGMANQTAQGILDEFTNAGKIPALEQVAAKVYEIIEGDRLLRLQSGLIDQSTYDKWKDTYNFYVPLKGFAEFDGEEDSNGPNLGRGISVSKYETKIALGRKSLSSNPLLNAIMQSEEGIIRSEKNKAATALLKLARQYPNKEAWVIDKVPMKRVLGADGIVKTVPDMSKRYDDNVVVAKIGGIPYYIQLNSVPLAEAYKRMGVARLTKVPEWVGSFGRFFSKLQTSRNPAFLLPNMSRDFQEALFTAFAQNPKLAAGFVSQYIPALTQAIMIASGQATPNQLQIADEWSMAGGKISYNGFNEIKSLAKELEEILGGIDPLTFGNMPKKAQLKALGAIKKVFAALDHMAEPLENATRLAMYRAARKYYSPAKSAELALESTVNFNRRGAWGPFLNSLFIFYNANTQGTLKMIRLLAKNNRARLVYASLIPLGFFITLLNLANSDDDEAEKDKKNYSNIPEYARQGSIIIKYGKGKDEYIRIPLAFGLKIPYYLGEQMAMVLTGQVDPWKAAGNVVGNTVDAFNPLGRGSLLNIIAPTLADPFVDIFTNKQQPSGKPIVPTEAEWNKGVPKSDQYFSTNSPAGVTIAQAVHKNTGIDLYPGWVDYAGAWAVGGLGRTVNGLYNWATNAYAGKETPIEKIPVASSFGPTADREEERYYNARNDMLGKANEMRDTLKKLRRNPKDEDLRAEVKELSIETGGRPSGNTILWGVGPVGILNKTDDELSKIKKAREDIKNNNKFSPLEKERRIEWLNNKMEQKMINARKIINKPKQKEPVFAPLSNMIR
jgi:hypothetical protein